jgi:hypothetical protein
MAASRKKSRTVHRQGPTGERPGERRVLRPFSALLLALAVAGAAGWAYSTSFAGVFVFDDRFAIIENPNIKALWPLSQAMSAPPDYGADLAMEGRRLPSMSPPTHPSC